MPIFGPVKRKDLIHLMTNTHFLTKFFEPCLSTRAVLYLIHTA